MNVVGNEYMGGKVMHYKKRKYAIAIRDGNQLFMFLSICRSPKNDVYVNFPRDHVPNWKPHSSYHASGQHHQKSFGHKALVSHRQKPDINFLGMQNVITTGISSDEPRAIDIPCQITEFHEVFEIPVSELSPEKYHTMISVDITEVGGDPIFSSNALVLSQAVFKCGIPWIFVTLFSE